MLGIFTNIFEIIMVICFGASWPFNIIRSYKARTAKGTSLLFMMLIGIGYVAGIMCKVLTIIEKGGLNWLGYVAFAFYILNLLMVSTGIAIYFRNKKIDKSKAEQENQNV